MKGVEDGASWVSFVDVWREIRLLGLTRESKLLLGGEFDEMTPGTPQHEPHFKNLVEKRTVRATPMHMNLE
jgi:hypothetical protein